jgi:hypothetical protein
MGGVFFICAFNKDGDYEYMCVKGCGQKHWKDPACKECGMSLEGSLICCGQDCTNWCCYETKRYNIDPSPWPNTCRTCYEKRRQDFSSYPNKVQWT